MQDEKKWFDKYDVMHLFHDASLISLLNETCLQHECDVACMKGQKYIHMSIKEKVRIE